jgi:hypothetical protein
MGQQGGGKQIQSHFNIVIGFTKKMESKRGKNCPV